MSLYLRNLEKQEKCTLLERLDMSKDEDYYRAMELLKLTDYENFLLTPGYVDRNMNDILFFLWDPKNEKICGFMEVSYLKNMEGEVDALTLHILTSRSFKDTSYKKERIGQILIDELINEAKSDPRIEFITIESVAFNWDAHKFYQKMGFKFVGKSKRPLLIIRKKPSLNRFLYISGNFPESEGWDVSEMEEKTLQNYSEIDRKYDPEGKYTMEYSKDDLEGVIYCKNFILKSYNMLLEFIYIQIEKNNFSDELKSLLIDRGIFDDLISFSFQRKNSNMFIKLLKMKLSIIEEDDKFFLPTLKDIIDKFGKEVFYNVIFDIYLNNNVKLGYFLDLNISHPYFQVLEDLYERRYEASEQNNQDLVMDLNMLMLGLYYYDQKDIVNKVLEHIKKEEIKNELLDRLK